ncbi:MAG: hypothetical protein FWD89_01080 [Firmicutes bacterium]|nr:hypothetical protein [Bacillota bacterium]MCL2770886.1 hypothetical protein [Bacillota bacterium]
MQENVYTEFYKAKPLTMARLQSIFELYDKSGAKIDSVCTAEEMNVLFSLWENPTRVEDIPEMMLTDKIIAKTALKVIHERFKEEVDLIIENNFEEGEE